ncbi:lactonase family protein [Rubrivivax gelatinosus]|uniref:6-phosphogluconolactonase (Cycloisomerase 2 family) n=1 Tax=Rubrivivax gelatinosus TaxID=28068 RepID=A0ABS1DTC9_RUBGE|nr:beta-propeller fold lactonase family protein [Rubrivivax gelatinosus]MBK1713277.1 hypothetical protein [Rubrivivax gelatinosus]
MSLRPKTHRLHFALPAALLAAGLLAACGGGSDSGSYTLGGTISGLATDGLVLANGSDTLAVASGATRFTFDGTVSGSYAVSISSQPSGQTCQVSKGSGSASGDVASVAISCRTYRVYVANSASNTLSQFAVGSGGTLAALGTATLGVSYAPSALVVNGDGSRAWLNYRDDEALTVLDIDSSGALSVASVGAEAATFGYALALAPDESHLYALNYGGASVSQFSLASSGKPSALSPASAATGLSPYALAITPDGAYAYVANASDDTISQYAVSSSGALTAKSTVDVSSRGSKPQGLAVAPGGGYLFVTLAGSAKVLSYAINSSTGALTYSSSQSTGTTPRAIVLSSSGAQAYVANAGSATVSQFLVSGGTLTPMATRTVATGSTPSAITITPDNAYLYVANAGDGTVSQYTLGSGGALGALGTVGAGGSSPVGIVAR